MDQGLEDLKAASEAAEHERMSSIDERVRSALSSDRSLVLDEMQEIRRLVCLRRVALHRCTTVVIRMIMNRMMFDTNMHSGNRV